MAKYTIKLPLKGTYGEVNFYYRQGKPTQRKGGGGFTSESIKNSPKMQGIRDNNSEFGHCSRIKKHFMEALMPFFGENTDGTLHGRLMKLFMAIKDLDEESAKGQRTISRGMDTATGRRWMKDFAFTPGVSVQRVLGGELKYEAETGFLIAPRFDPKTITYPKGADCFIVLYAVLDFDFETGDFEVFAAAPLVVEKGSPAFELVLRPDRVPSNTGKTLAVAGVRFYERVNDGLYALNSVEAKGVGVTG